ncbi:cytochrome c oxidase assembly factor 3 homolog, mitochondrial [Garra rufa]|uniref:cytochrome c oxidase assembly factor 3 homolog, mitochondrial n=1 Tax=Garra rufa TaxID=137080 RepID=UPI003CCEA8B9
MADKRSQGEPKPEAQFAKRIDPAKAELTREQLQFIRQVELAQWKKKSAKLRGRNVATGLAIGAVVLGIYGYTFYSVSQERIMDEIDEEAKAVKLQTPKTGAN